MTSWRIGQRLGLGFAVGVVFLIVVGWLSLRGMAVLEASLQKIGNERSVVVGLTNQVLQLSIDNARITMQLLMVPSGPSEERLLAQNKENQLLIGAGVEKIEKLLSTDQENLLEEFSVMPHSGTDRSIFHVTFSAGVAGFAEGTSVDAWRQAADDALYAAKSAGRHRVTRAKSGSAP